MIERLSITIADRWGAAGTIESQDVELYRYGLELLISSLINLLLTIAISVFVGKPLSFIPFLLSFIPLRSFAGGYHAESHLQCILTYTILFTLSLLLSHTLPSHIATLYMPIISLLSCGVLYWKAPVAAKNKPQSESETIRSRKIVRMISSILMLLGFICSILGLANTQFLMMLFTGELAAVILLLI